MPFSANDDTEPDLSGPDRAARLVTAHGPVDPATDDLSADATAIHGPAADAPTTWPSAADTPTLGGPAADPTVIQRSSADAPPPSAADGAVTDANGSGPLPDADDLSAAGRDARLVPGRPPGREQGPSPWEAERVRPLNRLQVEDRFPELGDLYVATTRTEPEGAEPARAAFLHRLACDVRRPGFSLVIAEARVLTGCAYGYPVRADGQAGPGPDGRPLPRGLLQLARAGRLFAVSEIVVPSRVRSQHLDREWNLARRLQRRLLDDHGAVAGVAMVRGTDLRTVRALRSWGWKDWRDAERDDGTRGYAYGRGARTYGPCHVLTLDL